MLYDKQCCAIVRSVLFSVGPRAWNIVLALGTSLLVINDNLCRSEVFLDFPKFCTHAKLRIVNMSMFSCRQENENLREGVWEILKKTSWFSKVRA